nr:hypothetical protein [Actinomycetota bacterium]
MEPTRDVYEEQAEQFWPRPPAEGQTGSDSAYETEGEAGGLQALATLACDEGLLTQEQVREAVAEGLRSGERLGEALLRLGWLDERQLAGLIARQRGMQYLDAVDLPDGPPLRTVLQPAQARALGAVAVSYENGQPLIALADPSDEQLAQLASLFGGTIVCAIVTRSTLEWLLERVDENTEESPESAAPEPSEPAASNGAAGSAAAAPAQSEEEGWHDLKAQLEETDQLLGTLRRRFDGLRELDAAAKRQLTEAREEGERLRAGLAERTQEAERVQAELGERTHEVERLQAEAADRTQEIERVQTELGERTQEVER